jgi:L-alanine-DL-glutamate epimerase-like enolase superfamily enzyme
MDRMVASTASERVDLELDTAFRISRGSTVETTNHLVTVTDRAGRVGIGGAAPAAYYGEDGDSVAAALPDLLAAVESVGDPGEWQTIERRLAEIAPDEAAARAGVSIAVHDLVARQRGEPLYREWGLDPERAPATSVTVGIDDPEEMATRAREWRAAGDSGGGYPALKIKLGTGDDRARLRAVREAAPEASLRVDANGDWSAEEALAALPWLDDLGVTLLEQPVSGDDHAGLARVTGAAPMPVAADESCVTATDVPDIADAVDVVVVKLMKCGGLGPARRQIAAAHASGLDVMLGCMVETSAAIAGAAHLAPLARYADLDGALLLAEDPCTGLSLPDGEIDLAAVDRGTGVRRR